MIKRPQISAKYRLANEVADLVEELSETLVHERKTPQMMRLEVLRMQRKVSQMKFQVRAQSIVYRTISKALTDKGIAVEHLRK